MRPWQKRLNQHYLNGYLSKEMLIYSVTMAEAMWKVLATFCILTLKFQRLAKRIFQVRRSPLIL